MIEVAAAYVGAMAAGCGLHSYSRVPAAPSQRRCERHGRSAWGVALPGGEIVHLAATWAILEPM